METSFLELKRKDVVNVLNGKKLGRITNVIFSYPEAKVAGIVVPENKGFCFYKREIYIPLACIVKIGSDVILAEVKLQSEKTMKPCLPPTEKNTN